MIHILVASTKPTLTRSQSSTRFTVPHEGSHEWQGRPLPRIDTYYTILIHTHTIPVTMQLQNNIMSKTSRLPLLRLHEALETFSSHLILFGAAKDLLRVSNYMLRL